MAKPASIKIRLNSSADTGYFYVTKKYARTKTDKLVMKKYDPVVRKHVEFKEGKIKEPSQASEFSGRRPAQSGRFSFRRRALSRGCGPGIWPRTSPRRPA